MSNIPFFAAVGNVNTGKTSTIASLLEDDSLRISSTPGETTDCQRSTVKIDNEEILGFYDTPGFQNAKGALLKLQALSQPNEDPLEAFRRFVAQYGRDPDYAEECKLFRPIIGGAGILYVADASQAFREINDAEMTILRMTGSPRMGLINTTSEPTHEAIWEARMGQHFNLVRRFNAHQAGYCDRMDLLQALAGIKQDWRPALDAAIAAYRRDWEKRTDDCAEIITELLVFCLQHTETIALGDRSNPERLKQQLITRFEETLRRKEGSAHREIIGIFKHHRIRLEESTGAFHQEDLFSEAIWRLCGLNDRQLILAAAVAGAAGGLAVDAALMLHTLGAGAAVGAAAGAGGAYLAGKTRPKIDVTLPGRLGRMFGRQKLAGDDLKVGPLANVNFPWILLDRSLAVFYFSVHRSHAKQSDTGLDVAEQLKLMNGKGILTQEWEDAVREESVRFFTSVRKGKATHVQHQEFRQSLVAILQKLVES